MNYVMSVRLYDNCDLIGSFNDVLNVDRKNGYVRLFLADGDVKTYVLDDTLDIVINFVEFDEYPF